MADYYERPEYKRCLNEVLAFCPPTKVPKINILLLGGVSSGKSSIVSTLDSLFKGRISRRAEEGQGTGSYTRTLRKYSFKTERREANGTLETKETPFVLWDSAGWSNTFKDYNTGELGYVLGGNLPNGFDLSQTISPQRQDFIAAPDLADRVHCVCFVVPCEGISYAKYMRRLRELKECARDRGIPALVLLTKIDECDPRMADDVSEFEDSDLIMSKLREVACSAGVGGVKDVFPIKNFSSDYWPDTAAGILLLRALQHALYAAVDYMEAAQEALIGNPQLQVPEQGPHLLGAVAASTPNTGCMQADKDCDMEAEDWEAVPLKKGPT